MISDGKSSSGFLLPFFLICHLKIYASTQQACFIKKKNTLFLFHTEFVKLFLSHRNKALNFVRVLYSPISLFSVSSSNSVLYLGICTISAFNALTSICYSLQQTHWHDYDHQVFFICEKNSSDYWGHDAQGETLYNRT